MENNTSYPKLTRELGWFSATLLGLGSIIGTGVFVSIGIAAGITGHSLILAIVLAALVATCNAFSSAQLAASHAVSGGTYEYGYRYLHPCLGFTAGWMFLCAKTASAATAALGFSGYLLSFLNIHVVPNRLIAVGTIVIFTLLVATGIKKSNFANIIIVSITLISLIALIVFGWAPAFSQNTFSVKSFFPAITIPLEAANKTRCWPVASVGILSLQWMVDCGVLIEKTRRTSELIRGFFS
ncbi:MAG: amino acid permease [Legionellales bacterium]|nr:amino acid permease [Legionellales bacterium]